LHEPDTGIAGLGSVVEHREHQAPAYAPILRARIDRDRPYAGNRAALVKKVAADDPPTHLRDDRIEAGIRQQPTHEPDTDFRRREIPRKIVLARNRFERFETNRPARRGILGLSGSQNYVHGTPLHLIGLALAETGQRTRARFRVNPCPQGAIG
jgi:hypothetical protein